MVFMRNGMNPSKKGVNYILILNSKELSCHTYGLCFIQVMMQPYNRHMSFSIYISALAVSDTIAMLIGELAYTILNSYLNFNIDLLTLSSAICLFTLLFSAFPTYLNKVQDLDMPPSQHGFCTMQVFMLWSSLLCSTFLLIAMTFERFYSITRPHKAASFNTVNRARIGFICIVVFSFTYSSPFLFISTNIERLCVPNRFASNNVLGEGFSWFQKLLSLFFLF